MKILVLSISCQKIEQEVFKKELKKSQHRILMVGPQDGVLKDQIHQRIIEEIDTMIPDKDTTHFTLIRT